MQSASEASNSRVIRKLQTPPPATPPLSPTFMQKAISSLRLILALALLSPAVLAAAQSPPVAKLVVAANVLSSGGVGWDSEVRIQVSFPGVASSGIAHATPDAQGDCTVELMVPASAAQSAVQHSDTRPDIEIWTVPPDRASVSREWSTFLTQAAGAAAFVDGTAITYDSTSGHYAATVSVTMSEPPLYGTLTVPAAPAQGTTVTVGDFISEPRGRSHFLDSVSKRLEWPAGAATLPLYRWSLDSGSSVILRGPKGTILLDTALRRGDTLGITPPRENQLSVSVDETAHGEAYAIVVVEQTVPAEPLSTWETGGKSIYFKRWGFSPHRRRVEFDSGSCSVVIYHREGPYRVELWGKRTGPVTGFHEYALLDSALVPSSPGDVTLDFD